MAKTAGCFSIVFYEKGQVLLAKRKDYPLWDLPGGKLEEGEHLKACAIREAREETGYIISIRRKIGEYYQPQMDDVQYIFLGEIQGGSPIEEGAETEKVGWFNVGRLPILMIPNRKKQIKNYFRHKDTIVKDVITVSPFRISIFKLFLGIFGKLFKHEKSIS